MHDDWKGKQAARAVAAEALRAVFPMLAPANGKGGGLVAAAKNVRAELALAFPGVKFSVKSRRYAGGDAIDVRWIDGPCSELVDPILNKYCAGTFDGSDDLYSYHHSAWKDAFGEAKYISAVRDYSDGWIAAAIRLIEARYPQAAGLASVEAYRTGKLRDVMAPDAARGWQIDDMTSLINHTLGRRTAFAAPVKVLEVAEKEEAVAAV